MWEGIQWIAGVVAFASIAVHGYFICENTAAKRERQKRSRGNVNKPENSVGCIDDNDYGGDRNDS